MRDVAFGTPLKTFLFGTKQDELKNIDSFGQQTYKKCWAF
jgi:hypothetical protein